MSVGVTHLGRHFSKVTEAPGNPTLPIPHTLPGNSFILMVMVQAETVVQYSSAKRPMAGQLTPQKARLFYFFSIRLDVK